MKDTNIGLRMSYCYAIGTACMVCRAVSMKRYGVRLFVSLSVHPSVCLSMGPQQQTHCCRFAAMGLAGKRYQSIAAWLTPALLANESYAMLSLCVGS